MTKAFPSTEDYTGCCHGIHLLQVGRKDDILKTASHFHRNIFQEHYQLNITELAAGRVMFGEQVPKLFH
jgi:hypothetical protein